MTKKKYAPYVTKGGLDVQKLDKLQRIQLLITGGIDKIDPKTGKKRNVWKEGFVDPALWLGKKSLQIANPILKQIHKGHTKAAELQILQQERLRDERRDFYDKYTYDTDLSNKLGRSVTRGEARELKETSRKEAARQDILKIDNLRKPKTDGK